ncbi:hypothetical protein R6Q59_015738 [Mikania micrantha]
MCNYCFYKVSMMSCSSCKMEVCGSDRRPMSRVRFLIHLVLPTFHRRAFGRVFGSGFPRELVAGGLGAPSVWTSSQLGHPLAIGGCVRCTRQLISWLFKKIVFRK